MARGLPVRILYIKGLFWSEILRNAAFKVSSGLLLTATMKNQTTYFVTLPNDTIQRGGRRREYFEGNGIIWTDVGEDMFI